MFCPIMEERGYDYLLQLLLMGDSGVGKSSLLSRFCDQVFDRRYTSTIGVDFKVKTIEVDGKRIKLQIWDTAGQERFHSITKSYYRRAKGILLIYDVCDLKTFRNVQDWIKDISENTSGDTETILVGNKCDNEVNRQVPYDAGLKISEEYTMKFLETSAKCDRNVNAAFHELTVSIMKKLQSTPPPSEFNPITDEDLHARRTKNSSKCC